ncbi:MAG: OsmC family protein [Alphaproteobacteria bacterium]|nr:OsmC family protein [Alphaproteobacteria bacterium]
MATARPFENTPSAPTPKTINGVDTEALGATIDAITADPSIAGFQFRLVNRWIDGGHNRSVIKGFYGAGEEDATRTEPFVLDSGEPPVLLGTDTGPNPVEYLQHALIGCLTTSIVYHAAARGIAVRSLTSEVEGEVDLRGFLGLADDVPKGYKELRVKFRAESDGDAETLRECASFSPVYNTLGKSVPVKLEIETV